MNHELILLKNAPLIRRRAKKLYNEALTLAVNSFSTERWRGGSLGQAVAIAHIAEQRDQCLQCINALKGALQSTPAGYRALLLKVYVQKSNKQCIAKRYGVSLSTLYRTLGKARKSLREQLNYRGCNEQWFKEHFAQYCG